MRPIAGTVNPELTAMMRPSSSLSPDDNSVKGSERPRIQMQCPCKASINKLRKRKVHLQDEVKQRSETRISPLGCACAELQRVSIVQRLLVIRAYRRVQGSKMDLTEIWQIRASAKGPFHLPAEP